MFGTQVSSFFRRALLWLETEYLADNFPHLQMVLKLLPDKGKPNQSCS